MKKYNKFTEPIPDDEFYGYGQTQLNKAANELSYRVDLYVKLHIQPKPKYLPTFIWKYLLKKLLVLDQFEKNNLS